MVVAHSNLRLLRAPSSELKKVDSALDLIGDTPLLQITRIAEAIPSRVLIRSFIPT